MNKVENYIGVNYLFCAAFLAYARKHGEYLGHGTDDNGGLYVGYKVGNVIQYFTAYDGLTSREENRIFDAHQQYCITNGLAI